MKYFPLSVLVAILILLVPDIAAAQSDFFVCEGTGCSACHFAELGNRIIKWLIGIVAMLFAILMAVAGVRLVTSGGNQTARDSAKSSLTNAIIGLLIILASWLLVDTIMRTLIGNNGVIEGYGPWSEIQCWEQVVPGTVAFQKEQVFIQDGGDHGIEEGGAPVAGGSGANCPVPPASEMADVPTTYTEGGRSGIKIRPDILRNFERMYAAAQEDGVTLKIRSGWRSEEEQIRLYKKYKGKSAVATPCSMGGSGSNHNSGVAIDIAIGCSKTDSSCNSKEYRWMKENGAQYGFRNALPRDTVHWSPSGR